VPYFFTIAAKMRSGLKGVWAEADAGGISQRVADRGIDRIIRALVGAERTKLVRRLGKEDFGSRHIAKLRQAIVAKVGLTTRPVSSITISS
jgi:hypothetical protein